MLAILGDVDEYLRTTRRKRSQQEMGEPGSRRVSGTSEVRGAVTSVSRAPANITRAQRLLQTGMLGRQGGPLVPERLELHIPAIRHSYTMQQGNERPKRGEIREFVGATDIPNNMAATNKDKWTGWNKQLQVSVSKSRVITRPGVDKVKPKGWFKYSLQID